MTGLSRYLLFGFFVINLIACTPRMTSYFVSPEQMETYTPEDEPRYNSRQKINASCLEPYGYIPDTTVLEQFRLRRIRVAFHFMNSSDSSQNFNGEEAEAYAQNMLHAVNGGLAKNIKLNLPLGNDIPVLPGLIRFELAPDKDGKSVYSHYDDELFWVLTRGRNRNNADRKVIDKYGRKDSLINVFVMPHHPDSVASDSYSHFASGIALGTDVKIFGGFENNMKAWQMRGLLAHEFGHVLNLAHAWTGYDGCNDTPRHNNCFNFTSTPPCDKEVSNNLMDYNAYQNALSPCQIGKMHEGLSRINSSQRKLLIKDWCELNENRNIFIERDTEWTGSKDLSGHLIIREGAKLFIKCRVSFPAGAKIIVEPGAELYLENAWLHNDCGDTWDGIEVFKWGKDLSGKVFRHGEINLENSLYSDNKNIISP